MPPLHKLSDYKAWQQALTRHYKKLVKDPAKGVVRGYGSQNPAEFFAVATEMFFERPRAMYRRAPDLYKVLATFYRVPLLQMKKKRAERRQKKSA